MKSNKILGISINPETKSSILENILLYIGKPSGFFHIVSVNPENLVTAVENQRFKNAIETAKIKIVDGVGIVIAGRWLNVNVGERVTGVGLMRNLLDMASERRLRVMLIGGRDNLALKLAKCYSNQFPEARFIGLKGIEEIKRPRSEEEGKIFSIVADYKPQLVFVAFGSPDQELWIERHRKKFSGCVVMGVGGSFDYLSGNINRAPIFIQKIGLEWLYRLIIQPWRWKRQLKLLKFIGLVLKEKWIKN